jgi:hypothetical protein
MLLLQHSYLTAGMHKSTAACKQANQLLLQQAQATSYWLLHNWIAAYGAAVC